MKTGVSIALICAATPCFAQPDSYLGTRCSAQEDIHIEPDGIGFNEHTICDWIAGPTVKTYSLHGVIACENVYILDASTDPVTTETLDAGTRHLRLVQIDNIDIDVYLDLVPLGRFVSCG